MKPELVHFSAHDSLSPSGWLYRLKHPTGAYVLSFHGGSEGQQQPGFRSDYQALLEQGIGVFAPNVRGSFGFGKRFVNLDKRELRINSVCRLCAGWIPGTSIQTASVAVDSGAVVV